jgi:hypothetical protein
VSLAQISLKMMMVNVVQACATWLVHHPYLLGDKECLATVVEVAELGVSGSKSQQKASDPPVMKVDLSALYFHNSMPEANVGNPQILGLNPLSKSRKFLRRASPHIANLQICND